MSPSPIIAEAGIVDPVRLVQVSEPILYSHVALVSKPETVTSLFFVNLSVLSTVGLVSCVNAMVGVATLLSKVKTSALLLALSLPAIFTCFTTTDFAPSPFNVKLVPEPSIQALLPT